MPKLTYKEAAHLAPGSGGQHIKVLDAQPTSIRHGNATATQAV